MRVRPGHVLTLVVFVGVISVGLLAASNWRNAASDSHKEKETREIHRHQERMHALDLRYGLANRRLIANTFLIVFRSASKAVTARDKVGAEIVRQLLRVVKAGLPRIRFGFPLGRRPPPPPPKAPGLRLTRLSPIVADPTQRIVVRIRVTERHTHKQRPGVLVLLNIPNLPVHYERVTGLKGIVRFTIPARIPQLLRRDRIELFVRARPADQRPLSPATVRRLIEIRLNR